MTTVLRWAWLILVALALLGWAQMHRYQPFLAHPPVMLVWDRWTHRVCLLRNGDWICGSKVSSRPRLMPAGKPNTNAPLNLDDLLKPDTGTAPAR